jgi:hypothetical protein
MGVPKPKFNGKVQATDPTVRCPDHCFAAIDPNNFAFLSDQVAEKLGIMACSAPNIENPISLLRLEQFMDHRSLAVAHLGIGLCIVEVPDKRAWILDGIHVRESIKGSLVKDA